MLNMLLSRNWKEALLYKAKNKKRIPYARSDCKRTITEKD